VRDFFDYPHLLYLLWIMPVLALLYAYGFARKRAALQRFASANLLGTLMPHVSTARQKLKSALALAALAFMIVGMAAPRWGSHFEDVQRKGVDIIVALDVSRSMLAEDIAPNRLERAKLAVSDLLDELQGDRIGLVTFAGTPVRKCPLTINYGSFKSALDPVTTESAPRGGSMLGDAVRLARQSFVDKTRDYKAIILISDGGDGDEASYPVEAAADAYEQQGVRVYCVGIGDADQGARIPVVDSGKKSYLMHDGQEVWTKLTPDVLVKTAGAGHGKYLPAGTGNFDLGPLYQDIRWTLGVTEFETKRIETKLAQFQWFAAAALVLLIIETMMTDRKAAVAVVAIEEERLAA
jgi:Ca-activated chloride channel family protein